MNTYKVSKDGLNLIKKWEGFYDKAYLCPAKVWTIGYGTTKYSNGKKVSRGDRITQAEALLLLERQVNEHMSQLPKLIKVKLTQNQIDALASFHYNLGAYILTKDKTLLNYINNQQWNKVAEQMSKYNKGGGKVLKGLVNRRKDEVALFLKPTPADESIITYVNETVKDMSIQTLKDSVITYLKYAKSKGYINDSNWIVKAENGTLSIGDLIGLFIIIKSK